ncbi:uncharacterized protein HMPREF1541_02333 [Cyphellophora europaea CBS 101466]|uniref:NADP-dependent oxidoreductase domain-containing protein n=1 Tax=Cyphellophora europaea (strain CBS 101466) TaxID=1220924 RepID=W2S3J1_CYPE1|nr:uncharacterized protein HMPREF1541_02333 [Cyphellophora europaea CBS 101466]ETN43175.1 hypothetical protein HMPREF1541_02333 [Cyphellophora europaea CBS 101466]
MGIKIVVGLMGSSVARGADTLQKTAGMQSFLDVCRRHKVTELDTARVYAGGKSEEVAGAVSACTQFAVSTKAPAFSPNSLTYDKIVANCNASLKALQTDRVDIYYLHGPDRATPLEDQCRAIGDLYAQGRFARFGVSNISPAEVQSIYDICQREGYPLPKIYQGGYNPIGRGPEGELFPLLKKLGMGFYAFSPLGGGLLAKPIEELLKPKPGTRFDEMKIFGDIYLTEEITAGLKEVQRVCDAQGVPLMEATMRWFRWHSVLAEEWGGEENGVIVGASSDAQLEESLKAWEGEKLPQQILDAWDALHRGLVENGKLPMYHS